MPRGRSLTRRRNSYMSVDTRRTPSRSPIISLSSFYDRIGDILMRDRSREPSTGPFGHPFKYYASNPPKYPSKRKRGMSTPAKMQGNDRIPVRRDKVYRRRTKYHTTGRLGPNFRKARSRKQLKKKDTQGATIKIETGGIYEVDTSDTAYIGHSVAKEQVIFSIGRVILKQLMNRARIPIKSWQASPNFDLTATQFYWISITYQNITNSGSNQFLYQLNSVASWDTLAKGLANKIVDDLTPTVPCKMVKISLFKGTSAVDATKTDASIAVINADDLHLHFEIYSKLNVQNRTIGQAVSGVTGDGDADLETNIVNNPLRGKVYTSTKKWLNGFNTNYQELGILPENFIANKTFGWIHTDSSLSAVGSTDLKKPPPPWYFGVSKAQPCTLKPGEIKSSVIKFKTSMKINTFLQKYTLQMADNFSTSNLDMMPFGFAEMIGLEKILDSRDETSIKISLSWELNQTYICYGTVKANYRSVPIVYVETVPQ